MAPVCDFAQCLKQLMDKHGLSAVALSAHTGSRAELRRVMQGEGSDARREMIGKKIIASGLFSSEECDELRHAMQVSRIGLDRYLALRYIEQIIHGSPKDGGASLRIVDGPLLAERLLPLQQADEVDVLCFNSCFPALYEVLAPLFDDAGKPVRMRHFIRLGENGTDAAKAIACVSRLLFDGRYQPFALPVNPLPDASQMLDGNFVSIRARRGQRFSEQFYAVADNDTVYELAGASRSGIYAFLNRILEERAANATPMKAPRAVDADVASMMMSCLSRELNRTTYYVCSDLLVIQVPPAIVEEAFRSGMGLNDEQLAQARATLLPLYEQRYQNFYYKKRPTYSIHTLDGCRRFLETGRHSDHFAGFRTYTPAERLEILKDLLDKARECPNYTPLMARSEAGIGPYILIGYEKLGVLVTLLDADYNVRNGYNYLFLTFPPFVELFIEYVQKQLILDGCYTRDETIDMLQALYDEYSEKFRA